MIDFINRTSSLYLITVFIWGSTFYAIKFQLGPVAVEISLIYRFLLASVILFVFCLLKKRNLRFNLSEHFFIFLQGLFLFSANYLVVYWATDMLITGVIALIFSTVILMNMINGAIFLRQSVSLRVILGSLTGVAGIAAVFWSEIAGMQNNDSTWLGLCLCLLATFSASVGNILSARNQKYDLPVVQTNAWGMAYGSLIMAVYALSQGSTISYDLSLSYSLSLLYLSIFGSVFAFGSYLTLIGRIGANKSAYSAVLYPVIALSISTLLEDYRWTLAAICGFGLVLLGNFLVLKSPAKVK
ncbi:MAG: EamA family transporter [Gammaproteobacteria bacterium]|nr:EamA family transporter [Gammaproteobacteria bacterium]